MNSFQSNRNLTTLLQCLFLLLFVLSEQAAAAQFASINWHRDLSDSIYKEFQQPGFDGHSTFHPQSPLLHTESWLKKNPVDTSTANICMRPVINAAAGATMEGRIASQSFAGLQLDVRVKNRWFFEGGYSLFFQSGLEYIDRFTKSRDVVPGVGKARFINGLGQIAHYPYGRLIYQAGRRINLELGNGKNFWGDGHRSLILSDNAPAYPYAKLALDVWRIRYNALYGMAKQGDRRKFFATHGLNMHLGKRLEFSFFEMVVWQDRDSLSERGLDLHYLNPLLFYRPVEYAQGSADNVLIGAGFKWRPRKFIQVYGQFVLDEFLLSSIRGRTGWWANKFGGQVGMRWFDVFKNFNWQIEGNAVRPFTYSHGSPVQAWGHMYQPLAHPLGSNFSELVNIFTYSVGDWKVENRNVYATFGKDMDADGDGIIDNQGGDVFKSYEGPFQNFGNRHLQGDKNVLHYNQLTLAHPIKKMDGFEWYVSHIVRFQKNNSGENIEQAIMVGIRMEGIISPVRDF